jgi:hypothetical protein
VKITAAPVLFPRLGSVGRRAQNLSYSQQAFLSALRSISRPVCETADSGSQVYIPVNLRLQPCKALSAMTSSRRGTFFGRRGSRRRKKCALRGPAKETRTAWRKCQRQEKSGFTGGSGRGERLRKVCDMFGCLALRIAFGNPSKEQNHNCTCAAQRGYQASVVAAGQSLGFLPRSSCRTGPGLCGQAWKQTEPAVFEPCKRRTSHQ